MRRRLTKNRTMEFVNLTDDAVLHIALLLQQDPLLGLLAFVGLRRSQRRFRNLLSALPAAETVRDLASTVCFDWTFPNFSSCRLLPADTCVRSRTFSTGFGHAFRLMLFPNGNGTDGLSLYVEHAEEAYDGWVRRATFTMRVHSDVDWDAVRSDVPVTYAKHTKDWGFREMFSLSDAARFLKDDSMHLSVEVTVKPPELTFSAMKRLLGLLDGHNKTLRAVLPAMVADLENAMRDSRKEHLWRRCPKCGAALDALQMPPRAAHKTRAVRCFGARMLCTTDGCDGCDVETAHKLLRAAVVEDSPRTPDWARWGWPVRRSLVPEDFRSGSMPFRYHNPCFEPEQRKWREATARCSEDVKCFLSRHG